MEEASKQMTALKVERDELAAQLAACELREEESDAAMATLQRDNEFLEKELERLIAGRRLAVRFGSGFENESQFA